MFRTFLYRFPIFLLFSSGILRESRRIPEADTKAADFQFKLNALFDHGEVHFYIIWVHGGKKQKNTEPLYTLCIFLFL